MLACSTSVSGSHSLNMNNYLVAPTHFGLVPLKVRNLTNKNNLLLSAGVLHVRVFLLHHLTEPSLSLSVTSCPNKPSHNNLHFLLHIFS